MTRLATQARIYEYCSVKYDGFESGRSGAANRIFGKKQDEFCALASKIDK